MKQRKLCAGMAMCLAAFVGCRDAGNGAPGGGAAGMAGAGAAAGAGGTSGHGGTTSSTGTGGSSGGAGGAAGAGGALDTGGSGGAGNTGNTGGSGGAGNLGGSGGAVTGGSGGVVDTGGSGGAGNTGNTGGSGGAGGAGDTGGSGGSGDTGGSGGAGGGCPPPINLVANAGFEEGAYAPTSLPDGWSSTSYLPSAEREWVDGDAHSGDRSVRITAPVPNDASIVQTVAVEPDTLYFLSGWIKTADVAHTGDLVDAGASFSIADTWSHSPGVFGTEGWTRTGVLFHSGSASQLTVAARLGFWAGTTAGTAWYDDVELAPIVPVEPHPRWSILVLIYDRTDFYALDAFDVEHHYLAQMTPTEAAEAELQATLFVEHDIPALTSGNMSPVVTVRHVLEPLSSLSSFGGGWWPAPENTAPERDDSFDSVIVIWDPRATDEATQQSVWLGSAAGLTPGMGTTQAYATLIIEAAITYGHRNVLKHEWGHSILEFFDAAGTAPKPKVENHAVVGQYVHCGTGEPYVWVDETDASPVPNSIYHNASGFTHDYYSGATASADDVAHCIGIAPSAWAMGGPVAHSGNLPACAP